MKTLYPQNNAARTAIDLGGIWDFRFSGDGDWQPIAVPASTDGIPGLSEPKNAVPPSAPIGSVS